MRCKSALLVSAGLVDLAVTARQGIKSVKNGEANSSILGYKCNKSP